MVSEGTGGRHRRQDGLGVSSKTSGGIYSGPDIMEVIKQRKVDIHSQEVETTL
jgi:hypothetical protein